VSTVELRIEAWTPRQFEARMSDAMTIYAQAMNYAPSAGVSRGLAAVSHTRLGGFACRIALTDAGEMVGFGYGYVSKPGQWWHELASRAIDRKLARFWMTDAFELSELHVLPAYQGNRIGRRLLLQLAEGLTNRTVVLSTPDADTRAFRMYRSLGFVDLARGHIFPGDSRPFAVLGRVLPFEPSLAAR
jgi:ribosomal protein S18 acetylase RimI-like enzyme